MTVTVTCDGGANAIVSSVYSFTTACGYASLPYAEDFSTSFLPNCWDEGNGGTPATGGPIRHLVIGLKVFLAMSDIIHTNLVTKCGS